ncbi:glycoside hydrolase family 9 protein [Crocosphaera sp. Alani8]|uniref:glycoside hydrolase family 9 protein n=1 Tax=Crocosphaera sp. Alani8 TaxID=3038952 RepID=UPI00313E5625
MIGFALVLSSYNFSNVLSSEWFLLKKNSPTNPTPHVYLVSPNVLAVGLEIGKITKGKPVTYKSEPVDIINDRGWILRNREIVGYLVDEHKSIMRTLDKYEGKEIDKQWITEPNNYQITSSTDEFYRSGIHPKQVFYKIKPIGLAQVKPNEFESPKRYTIYLKLPQELTENSSYSLRFQGNVLENITFTYDPSRMPSEAIHVSQLGFHPNDPSKVGFLSTWMGVNQPIDYSPNTSFWLIDSQTRKKVYQGKIQLTKSKNQWEDNRRRNYNQTNVYLMDFSDFNRKGSYQILVEGIGTSQPFPIEEKTWEKAFYVSVRGLYHQRSGIALTKPYTTYEQPRSFHPEDGVEVYQSTIPLMDTNMGLNLGKIKAFEGLQATRTDQTVPEAWGGWFDAADWDRRIQHLQVSRYLLELARSNTNYFAELSLNLPESNNLLPDIIDEALWGLDVFRRLQTPEGGIRGGIESASHPKKYEASWQESHAIMVYGPGIWSSYIYAGVAARAAYILEDYELKLSKIYALSAEKAMIWAEQQWLTMNGPAVEIERERNLAAAELYRLTESPKWHEIFLDTTVFKKPNVKIYQSKKTQQEDAAFVYAQTRHPSIDRQIQDNARYALIEFAEAQLSWIDNTGFKWQKHPHAPLRWGSSLGSPDTITLMRAHQLTGNPRFWQGIILATQFSAGANPDNLIYTTGLGQRSPQDPLIANTIATGNNPPPGITVYGPFDRPKPKYWDRVFNLFADSVHPWPTDWPTTEGYFDVFRYIPVTEYTVHQTIAPTAYTWGYLASITDRLN